MEPLWLYNNQHNKKQHLALSLQLVKQQSLLDELLRTVEKAREISVRFNRVDPVHDNEEFCNGEPILSCHVVLPLFFVTGKLDNVKENPRKLFKSPHFVGMEREKDLSPVFAEPALFHHYFSFYSSG